MRKRRCVLLKKDGTGMIVEEPLPDAPMAERFAELRKVTEALQGGLGPADYKHAYLACDGCDEIATVDYDEPQMPAGWTAGDRGDLCASCSSGVN